MSDPFSLMVSEFKELAEIKSFAEAQFKQIIELNKKLKNLEEENKHLKKLLDSSTKELTLPTQESSNGQIVQVSDEEAICVMQLRILKETSMDRELSLEESKKLDTFSKILNNIRNAPKTIKVEAKKLDDKDLMALLEND